MKRPEKHAGTNLGTAQDTNLANNQGSSAEAGPNSTITQPIEKPIGGPYDPETETIPTVRRDDEKSEFADDEDREGEERVEKNVPR